MQASGGWRHQQSVRPSLASFDVFAFCLLPCAFCLLPWTGRSVLLAPPPSSTLAATRRITVRRAAVASRAHRTGKIRGSSRVAAETLSTAARPQVLRLVHRELGDSAGRRGLAFGPRQLGADERASEGAVLVLGGWRVGFLGRGRIRRRSGRRRGLDIWR